MCLNFLSFMINKGSEKALSQQLAYKIEAVRESSSSKFEVMGTLLMDHIKKQASSFLQDKYKSARLALTDVTEAEV